MTIFALRSSDNCLAKVRIVLTIRTIYCTVIADY